MCIAAHSRLYNKDSARASVFARSVWSSVEIASTIISVGYLFASCVFYNEIINVGNVEIKKRIKTKRYNIQTHKPPVTILPLVTLMNLATYFNNISEIHIKINAFV